MRHGISVSLTRRHACALVGSAFAISALSRARAADTIHIMTPAGHSFMPAHYALAAGIYARHGLIVDVALTTNPPAMLPAVVAGSLQIGATSAVQLVESRDNGLDLVAVAGGNLQVLADPATKILVPAESPLRAQADFVGKRVVTPGLNGSFHVMFEHWLATAGVDPTRVQYVEAGYAQMGDMLRNGSVDAALAAEPFLSAALQSGKWRGIDYFAVPGRDHVYDAFLIASRAWTTANAQTLHALQASWAEACTAMNQDPTAARALEAKILKLAPEVLEKIHLPPFRTDITPADLQVWIDLCREQKLIKSEPTPAELMA
jgi:NitT/TauT family transport system substrate-binding protein